LTQPYNHIITFRYLRYGTVCERLSIYNQQREEGEGGVDGVEGEGE